MRSAAVLTALFAAGALAGPVKLKRDYVTEVTFVTVTSYVYVDAPAPTAAVEDKPADHHHHGPKPDYPEAPISSVAPEPEEPPSYEPSSVEAPAPEPSSEAPEPTEDEPAPAPTSEAPIPEPTSEEPAPEPTSETPEPEPTYEAPEPEPTYEAPAPTSEVPAPAPSSAQPPTSSTPPTGDNYQESILHHHNIHRANHSAPDLVWNPELANAASMLTSKCVFEHNTTIGLTPTFNKPYGQNLAASSPNANITAQITEGWYNGEIGLFGNMYGIGDPTENGFHGWGHFTQLVWKDTREVGCATIDCRGTGLGMWFTTCNYLPPGNVSPDYNANVIAPRGDPTRHWDDQL